MLGADQKIYLNGEGSTVLFFLRSSVQPNGSIAPGHAQPASNVLQCDFFRNGRNNWAAKQRLLHFDPNAAGKLVESLESKPEHPGVSLARRLDEFAREGSKGFYTGNLFVDNPAASSDLRRDRFELVDKNFDGDRINWEPRELWFPYIPSPVIEAEEEASLELEEDEDDDFAINDFDEEFMLQEEREFQREFEMAKSLDPVFAMTVEHTDDGRNDVGLNEESIDDDSFIWGKILRPEQALVDFDNAKLSADKIIASFNHPYIRAISLNAPREQLLRDLREVFSAKQWQDEKDYLGKLAKEAKLYS